MLADTAVAVNPDDDRYRDVVGKHAILPLVGRRLPVIADEHVDPEFGTGALKITPGHDPNDFEIGRAHGLDGDQRDRRGRADDRRGRGALPRDDGRRGPGGGGRGAARGGTAPRRGALHALGAVLPSLRGADRAADLAAVVLPHGRDGEAGDRRRRARGRSGSSPSAPAAVYLDWMEQDPALVHLPPALVGPPAAGLVPRATRPTSARSRPEGEGWEQESDVLDTWFSSALWPFATLGWPDTDAPS